MNTNKRELEDFFATLEVQLAENGMLQDLIYLDELKKRRLHLDDEISDETVTPIVKAILKYNAMDKDISVDQRKPIIIYLNTLGGEIDAGYRLIDTIVWSKTPVYIVNLGHCYSMGFLIFIAGAKRFASKNAKFLLHDGTTVVGDSSSKARDRIAFNDRIEAKLRDDVLTWTKISKEEYDAKSRNEWYMFADEAKQRGVVDCIIGIDCDIDEIV